MIRRKVVVGILLSCLAIGLFLSLSKVKEEEEVTLKVKTEKEEIKAKRIRRELVPDNPEDYGMIVFEQREEPVTQGEWDELLGEKVKKLKSKSSLDTWDKLEKAVKEKPQKTKEKIKDLDKRLKEAEAVLRKEPNNQETQKRIKRLRMLRAISRSLVP